MEVFEKTGQPKIIETKQKKHELPPGLWVKCKQCGEMLFAKELANNLKVCTHCDYHFGMSAPERIAMLADEGTFEETDADLVSVDKLGFTGVASYTDRLKAYQRQTGLNDAVVTGFCKLNGHPVSLAVMDFSFLGASMGSVVGEKITRAIEAATEREIPVVIVSTSGGARMYEGILSLMQMAKTSGALARHAQERLLFISILTHPTTAGVMASFASLGDIILAEPKALIGFAGPRVIKETTQQELPEGFQTSEFLLDHGLIDAIVHRKQLKPTVGKLLDYLGNRRFTTRKNN
ncbi:MAG: acetyl-CoA carboxylase, carboxyltransferase subunit beta [Verrucomicrobiae bacterium]|nr:acetyl-CoA carboxylase, carboxyltransferase subunit beta [Verrucomicrobiae bacterium]MDW8344522.1 acetyl-CoA carboxylase, carboxyltransferase subunit beta [Verrucomicrobiae bacterium]